MLLALADNGGVADFAVLFGAQAQIAGVFGDALNRLVRGVTMPQVAMAWVMSHPEITVAISGADTVNQIKDVAGALELNLPADAIKKLDAVSYGMRAILDGDPEDVDDEFE